MEPIRDTRATLVDLLDRILDKGLVINADLIVSVAGIPLLGVNLRAALAGMETMLQYGIMQAWDERTRAWGREEKRSENKMKESEKVAAATALFNQGMTPAKDEMETCPQCGRKAPVEELLEKGCPRCGWVSPRLKKATVFSNLS
jgi:hypothetical protein